MATAPRSVLVVVPGHGEPTRSHVTIANLRRIRAMHVSITCWMFVYGSKMTDNMLPERFPQCRFKRNEGLWMHHLRRMNVSIVTGSTGRRHQQQGRLPPPGS